MKITATSVQAAQQIDIWKTTYGSYWAAVRLIGWISQDKDNYKTTFYFKWQVGADNYWPYWYTSHAYSVTLGGTTKTSNFQLPQAKNTWVDLSTVQSITVDHTQGSSAYTYSGTLSLSGYKYWEAVTSSIEIEFPSISIPEETPSTDTDEDTTEYTNDEKDSRFYILCDDSVVYSANDPSYIVTNPQMTVELNQADSLDFTIPPTNAMYSSIDKLRSTIEVRQGSEIIFRGRVLDDDTDFYNQKSIHCEGAFTFLGDTVFPPYSEGTYTTVKALFKAAIDSHYSQVPSSTPKRRLRYVSCNMTDEITTSSEDYQYTSDVVSDLLSNFGGFLKIEYFTDGTTGISYLSQGDHSSAQTIDFGYNLIDLTSEVDASSVFTAVIVQGDADETTGDRPVVTAEDSDAVAKYGRIVRFYTIDGATTTDELSYYAQAYLLVGVNPSESIEVKAVDLHLVDSTVEKIRIGDYVRVRSLPHGIDGYYQCSNIDIDMTSPENTVYTFGSTSSGLTDSYGSSGSGTGVYASGGGSSGGGGSGDTTNAVTNVRYDSSGNKIVKTINSVTTDVVDFDDITVKAATTAVTNIAYSGTDEDEIDSKITKTINGSTTDVTYAITKAEIDALIYGGL